jgi:hypothetical protein
MSKSPSMTAKHKFLCKRISKLVMAAKLRLKILIITDNTYIEISSHFKNTAHEIFDIFIYEFTSFSRL